MTEEQKFSTKIIFGACGIYMGVGLVFHLLGMLFVAIQRFDVSGYWFRNIWLGLGWIPLTVWVVVMLLPVFEKYGN